MGRENNLLEDYLDELGDMEDSLFLLADQGKYSELDRGLRDFWNYAYHVFVYAQKNYAIVGDETNLMNFGKSENLLKGMSAQIRELQSYVWEYYPHYIDRFLGGTAEGLRLECLGILDIIT